MSGTAERRGHRNAPEAGRSCRRREGRRVRCGKNVFGSVTAINGHVHQLMTKVEGNVTFYAGRGTAYPLPAPGAGGAPAAKPPVLPANQLRPALGIRTVNYVAASKSLDVNEQTLA
jgi:3',5'-cyclic-AMP phosphodiesterase